MTRQEQLAFCRICYNRKMSKKGLICQLTEAKADFETSCNSFKLDYKAQIKREDRDRELAAQAAAHHEPFDLEARGLKAGILGGILMMIVAIVWIFVAYEEGYSFFYPPVLFLVGLGSFVKGLIDGNIIGEKYRK